MKADSARRLQLAQVAGESLSLDPDEVNQVWLALNTMAWCFSDEGLIELDDEDDAEGDRYYVVNPAGQKARISALATPGLRDAFEQVRAVRDVMRARAHA